MSLSLNLEFNSIHGTYSLLEPVIYLSTVWNLSYISPQRIDIVSY